MGIRFFFHCLYYQHLQLAILGIEAEELIYKNYSNYFYYYCYYKILSAFSRKKKKTFLETAFLTCQNLWVLAMLVGSNQQFKSVM